MDSSRALVPVALLAVTSRGRETHTDTRGRGPDDDGSGAAQEDAEPRPFAVAIQVDKDVYLESVDGKGGSLIGHAINAEPPVAACLHQHGVCVSARARSVHRC